MISWDDGPEYELEKPNILGWFRFGIKLFLGVLTIGCLMIPLTIFRLLGFWRQGQFIVQLACRLCLKIVGVKVELKGAAMAHAGVVVANHSSWLDILCLNVCQRVFFVAKAEVKGWPGIGHMARSVGTVFIERKRGEAKRQVDLFLGHIKKGHKLLFFPEGTSTDGRRVLTFKSALFQAFFAPELVHLMWVQPVTVLYFAPNGKHAEFYGWWGDMDMAPHMVQILSQPKQGKIQIVFHKPLKVDDYPDRKALTDAAWKSVNDGLDFS